MFEYGGGFEVVPMRPVAVRLFTETQTRTCVKVAVMSQPVNIACTTASGLLPAGIAVYVQRAAERSSFGNGIY